ncbi:MAG: carboxypeptidase regulatory-like domain-containing protein [Anaerolineales bacterium]|nr:carboxypeptidase regulatory-like domain-containing protein [Anaerolineales bacterium]
MNKWNLIIDIAKCHDCNNCFLACKDEYVENDYPPYSSAQPRHGHRWVDILRKERGQYPQVDVSYLPILCMHCDDAPCMLGSETEAVYKREDGIVLIDPVAAKGRKDIIDMCPYGVIWWNEEEAIPQKCTLCIHLLEDGWKVPRCVQACPTGALQIEHIEDSEMQDLVESAKLEVYKPQYQTEPRVYYKNLYRYTKCFIAGNVVLKDIDECAEQAKITLKDSSGRVIDTAVTNNYGDFKIDDLEKNSGKYSLEIEYSGYPKQASTVDLENSINVGTIFL